MGREIIFRAWDGEYKYMMQPDEKSQVESENVNTIFWLLATKERHKEIVFMQYTGLKDENGVGIYEGDIVEESIHFLSGEIKTTIRIVEWDAVNPCFVMTNIKKKDDWEYDFVKCGMTFLKILGNRYENPELLVNPGK